MLLVTSDKPEQASRLEVFRMSPGATAADDQNALPTAFKQSMTLLTAGVAVVTTNVDGRPWGMTITACCSVSAEPPTVLISLAKSSVTARAIGATAEYGLCLLGAHGIETAKFGAAPGRPKFLDEAGQLISGVGRTPCAAGSIAHLDCVAVREMDAGDHIVFLGRVHGVFFPTSGTPLVYGSRQYQRTVPALHVAGANLDDHALAYSAW